MNPWAQLGWILAGSVALMAALWLVQRRTGDAGIVDVGWSYALAAAAIFAAATGAGDGAHRLAIGVLAGIWGIRLGTHILVRARRGEDGRYQLLREMAGERIQLVLFLFYQAQALLVPMLSGPFVLAAAAERPGLGPWALAGIVLWIGAWIGESIADRQLEHFKKRGEATRGKTCREGLWRYSRHPNYFFEWLMWVAYALIALEATMGWWAVTAPALILFLVLKVTGIPPTEKQSLRSRGDDYRDYQRTTSAFVPWPPRRRPANATASAAASGE